MDETCLKRAIVSHTYDVSKALLMRYIALALQEAHDARVPQQLVGEPDEGPQEDEGAEDVREFSAVGAGSISGFTAPLGMSPKRDKKRKE